MDVDPEPTQARLPNRPKTKLSSVPKGYRIEKRPLARPVRASQPPPSSTKPASSNGRQRQIYVSTKSPFMATVNRIRKALDRGPNGTRSYSSQNTPLSARVSALGVGSKDKGMGSRPGSHARAPSTTTSGQDDVLVAASGKAIDRALHIAYWFDQQDEYSVSLRTRSTGAVDDIVPTGRAADEGEEESARMRMVSVLDIGISLR